jgi:hypothetical protein
MNEKFLIYPPEGTTFNQCISCSNPMVYDGTCDKCLWCFIKEEKEVE